jgi:hypothetical protein
MLVLGHRADALGQSVRGQRSPQTIATGKAAIDKGTRHRIADAA